MELAASVRRLGLAALDLLFPPRCVGCGREGEFLCPSCRDALPRLEPPWCRACAQPLRGGPLCPRCRDDPLALEGIRSPFRMEGVAQAAVHALKYRNLRALAPPLGVLLADHLQREAITVDVVVPVPLHSRRVRERGYNQADLLARELGKRLDLPLLRALRRHHPTPPQARSAAAVERRANVQGAFSLAGPDLRGCRALLVDDVCTTGATLDACARVLREGGAMVVWGLTLAREP